MTQLNDLTSPLQFLLTRRSVPARMLQAPYPNDDELSQILTACLRVPDHKSLTPWRLAVMTQAPLLRLAKRLGDRALHDPENEARWRKVEAVYADAHLVVCCIHAPLEHADVPNWEQHLSTGAVCLSLVNAAFASGFAASWITGLPATQRDLLPDIKLCPNEHIAGLIHIGSCLRHPSERPRPKLEDHVMIIR